MTLGSGASFWRGLAVSLVSTSISECGDRSFFTATILSIRYPRLITFAATYLALLVQSLTSTTVGSILQLVVPQKTHLPLIPIISAILFGAFAISYLREAILQHRAQQRVISRQSSVASRKENIVPREEWAARLLEKDEGSTLPLPEEILGDADFDDSTTAEDSPPEPKASEWQRHFWKIFCLVYMAEVGDTSMVVTATLAANTDPIGVFCGAMIANAIVNGLGIWAGSTVSRYISEMYINMTAFFLFMGFAVKNISDTLMT
eukprot:Blabericola_migrator_1__500@NODE_1120_length_5378_cov_178_565054_g764_i0_p5_GENE_NODE_1120_length_5378_cov_178_565054_g764_i0NODE_1120_length_5378_cov_178_565054_g764_i0_p5_ORF_typecomplete_len262_score22_41UPF0016/PF01169_19/1_2e11UPF0016/PF01169_19/4_7e17DPM3/PF08285_11/0_17_NODE_1120_length_5378_cov_178_565054_g764_i031573942